MKQKYHPTRTIPKFNAETKSMHPTNKDMPAYSSGLVYALQKMFYGPKSPLLVKWGDFPVLAMFQLKCNLSHSPSHDLYLLGRKRCHMSNNNYIENR
jgi:hypothetical protein